MAKIRVYELAKELGIDSKRLLADLRKQGEFVRSASSTVEPPIARKIRESYASGGSGTPPPGRPPRRPENNPFKTIELRPKDRVPYRKEWSPRPATTSTPVAPRPLANRVGDAWPGARKPDVLDEAAGVFGVPRRQIKRRPEPKRRWGEQVNERRSPDEIDWINAFFDLSAMDVWLAAGLGRRDAALALRCANAGIEPADLEVVIDGHSVLYRINCSQPVEQVAEQLERWRQGQTG